METINKLVCTSNLDNLELLTHENNTMVFQQGVNNPQLSPRYHNLLKNEAKMPIKLWKPYRNWFLRVDR